MLIIISYYCLISYKGYWVVILENELGFLNFDIYIGQLIQNWWRKLKSCVDIKTKMGQYLEVILLN